MKSVIVAQMAESGASGTPKIRHRASTTIPISAATASDPPKTGPRR